MLLDFLITLKAHTIVLLGLAHYLGPFKLQIPMTLKTSLGRLRLFALLEGISYLLFAVTMPLKYIYQIPEPNYIIGMTHGFLFIGYIAFCLQCIAIFKWKFPTATWALLASIVPFGTFIADAQIFKKAA